MSGTLEQSGALRGAREALLAEGARATGGCGFTDGRRGNAPPHAGGPAWGPRAAPARLSKIWWGAVRGPASADRRVSYFRAPPRNVRTFGDAGRPLAAATDSRPSRASV